MATGRTKVSNRVTCNVCLEPYRKRQPKLLPCFHTFCLPCLTSLVEREEDGLHSVQIRGSGGQNHEAEDENSTARITCPTCRCVIPVPAGGVANFQTNFYIDDGSKEDSSPPVPCDMCNGEEEAQYQCNQCHNSFCLYCRHYHNTVCQGAKVTALQDLSDPGKSIQGPDNKQIKQQLQMVVEGLNKLREEKGKLTQEREAMENSIHVRYATLLRHASETHDSCLISLRQVCDSLTERLDSHLTEAQQTQDTLQRQLSQSQPVLFKTQLRATLFVQGDLQTILHRNSGSASLLRHQMKEDTTLLADCLESFMGKIVDSSQPTDAVQSSEDFESLEGSSNQGTVPSVEAVTSSLPAPDTKAWKELIQKVEELASRVTVLQSSNIQLSQNVIQLSNTSAALSLEQSPLQREMTALQREMTALKDKNAKLTTDHTTLQRELTALRDKNVIVHQDIAVLTAEKDNMHAELAKLQKDVITMQKENSQQQSDITKLTADHSSVASSLSSVQKDVTSLHGDSAIMKKDIDQLKTDSSSLKSDVKKDIDQLKTDSSSLKSDVKKDIDKLQTDCSSLKSDVKKDIDKLKTDCISLKSDVKKDIDKLKTDSSSLKSDVKKDTDQLKTDCISLKSDVKKDIDKLKTDSSSLKSDVKKDIDQLKTDCSSLKSDVKKDIDKLKTDCSSLKSDVKKDIDQLKTDCSSQHADMISSKSQVTSLQQKVKSAKDSLRDQTRKLTALESRFLTANTPVAFHAILQKEVTVKNQQLTLICGVIISSQGYGYNEQTGVFTAPLSGTYCFMATASPSKTDRSEEARLDIVLEDTRVGYLCSSGHIWSTDHTVVKMTAGQRVWLRTYSDKEYTFSAGWWTTFTGMLLQPDV